MKKKVKDNLVYFIIFGILLLIIGGFLLKDYIEKEINQYELYGEYSRAVPIQSLVLSKTLDVQYLLLKKMSSYSNVEKYTKGELIYDFAQYGFIPILNYLEAVSEDEDFVNSFAILMETSMDDFGLAKNNKPNIFLINSDGKRYTYENGIYTYKTKYFYIPKESFNILYYEYINSENIQNHFINILLANEKLAKKYTKNEISYFVNNNYKDFYKINEDDILDVIGKDLEDFNDFLLKTYIYIEKDALGNRVGLPVLLKDIECKEKIMTFKLKQGERIYDPVSKYYKYSYELDLEEIYRQLKELNLPILYI